MSIPAIGYLRVSTEEQGRSGLGEDAQREAIERAADYKGWDVVEWITDTRSGKTLNRPGIQRALTLLENGGPKLLVVAKADRLTRKALDFLTLKDRAEQNGWAIAMLQPDADMTTPSGRAMVAMMVVFAELEREEISARTKAALAAAKRRGTRLGPPRKVPPDVVVRIVEDRARGMAFATIARELEADGVPTPYGGRWSKGRVHELMRSVQLDEEAEAARGRA